MEVIDIDISKVQISPKNFRQEGDYEDEFLRQKIREAGVKLFTPLVVTLKGDVYEVISGNRSFTCLKAVAQESGVTLTTVPCIVKEYGSELEEILDIGLANEMHLSMSAIDLANWYQSLIDAGLNQSEVAERCNTTQPMVSVRLSMLKLPKDYQMAVHVSAHKDHYEQMTSEQLNRSGIRHRVEPDGSVRILHIPASHAKAITSAFPKKDDIPKFLELLNDRFDEILDVTSTRNVTAFKVFFKNEVLSRMTGKSRYVEIKPVSYAPSGRTVKVSDMYDISKADQLLDAIPDEVPDELRYFLESAAFRHAKFNYELIADYYATAPPYIQKLFREFALVIPDPNLHTEWQEFCRTIDLLRDEDLSEEF